MPRYDNIREIRPLLREFGRNRLDGDALYFNWTCSGLVIRFTGTTLKAELHAIGNPDMFEPETKPHEMPCLAVFEEDSNTYSKRFECEEGTAWYTLFEGEAGEHTIRLVKMSEASRGKQALLRLETDGELLQAPPAEKKLMIEYIGDSITCGYGNEDNEPSAPFATGHENGWEAYASVAARELNADYRCVSMSGIAVSRGANPMPFFMKMPCMEETYAYTDAFYDDLKQQEKEKWDFAANPVDVIVINLGTNDSNPPRFAPTTELKVKEVEHFRARYRAFVEQVRELNGPKPWIVCSLGTMDYFLYDEIRAIVEDIQKQNPEERISLFKFFPISPMGEGYGSAMHPSLKTHARMGHELAEYVRTLNL